MILASIIGAAITGSLKKQDFLTEAGLRHGIPVDDEWPELSMGSLDAFGVERVEVVVFDVVSKCYHGSVFMVTL